MRRDYYEILGLDRNASSEDVKKAFRQIGKKYHPDVSTEADAQQRFQEANEAYQVLSDPEKRRAYDRFGHAGVNFDPNMGGFSNFEDLFQDIMGSMFGGRQRSGPRRPRQGRDLRYDLEISFEQAVHGDKVTIEVPRYEVCSDCKGTGAQAGTSPVTCPDCQGQGQIRQPRQTFLGHIVTVTDCPRCAATGKIVEKPCRTCSGKGRMRENRQLTVNIPAGVDDGTQIRLAGEGDPGDPGAPKGHLYVVLNVAPHAYFKRRGHDILLEINLNMAQAALGDRILVPTIDGEQEVNIPAGTQPGTIIPLRGRGVPKIRSDGRASERGDQHCMVNVVVPQKLNPEQRQLLEQLRHSLQTDVVSTGSGKNAGIFDRFINFFGS
jgi:molecular chaperone DnaJ